MCGSLDIEIASEQSLADANGEAIRPRPYGLISPPAHPLPQAQIERSPAAHSKVPANLGEIAAICGARFESTNPFS